MGTTVTTGSCMYPSSFALSLLIASYSYSVSSVRANVVEREPADKVCETVDAPAKFKKEVRKYFGEKRKTAPFFLNCVKTKKTICRIRQWVCF